MRRALPILVLAIALATVATPAAAQDGTIVECADFSPDSVRDACDKAVPGDCRGRAFSGTEFDDCLRENGTTPEAVRAAIDAAYRAAGIPVGGVDTGLGGLAATTAAPGRQASLPGLLLLGGLAVGALCAGLRRRRREIR